ncbi:ABC transporter permease [Pseudomonas sp. Marseille-QA0892]
MSSTAPMPRLARFGGARLMTWVTGAMLILLVGMPLGYVLLQAVFPGFAKGDLSAPFGLLGTLLTQPALLGLVGNTLTLGLLVVVASALVGVPLGALRALTRVPGARLWDLMMLIPFMIPPYIAAFAWIVTLQPRGYAQQLTGSHAGGFLFSLSGIVFVMVLNVFPVVYFAVSRTLQAVGGRYAFAARVCGAGRWHTLWRISLPLSTPGIAASLLLVFALTIEEFGTPATLGAQIGYRVLVTAIHERFSDWPIDIPGASVLSLILVMLALLAFYLQHWLVTRRSFVTETGKPTPLVPSELGVWRWPVAGLFAAVAGVAVLMPLGAMLATAFTGTLSGGLTLENLSTRHFQALANNAMAIKALVTSLSLAVGTALLTGILGALAGYLVVRNATRGSRLLDALTLLPNAMPGVVVAVGLILAWNQSYWPIRIYNTAVMLLLAYSCLLLPYPVRYASAALRQMGENLEAAARLCGAGFFTAFRRIVLPTMAPSLIVAMLLVFAIASRELVASLMVAPAGMMTLSTFVFAQFEQGSPGMGMAMSCVAILSTTALLVSLTVLGRKRLPGV